MNQFDIDHNEMNQTVCRRAIPSFLTWCKQFTLNSRKFWFLIENSNLMTFVLVIVWSWRSWWRWRRRCRWRWPGLMSRNGARWEVAQIFPNCCSSSPETTLSIHFHWYGSAFETTFYCKYKVDNVQTHVLLHLGKWKLPRIYNYFQVPWLHKTYPDSNLKTAWSTCVFDKVYRLYLEKDPAPSACQ